MYYIEGALDPIEYTHIQIYALDSYRCRDGACLKKEERKFGAELASVYVYIQAMCRTRSCNLWREGWLGAWGDFPELLDGAVGVLPLSSRRRKRIEKILYPILVTQQRAYLTNTQRHTVVIIALFSFFF
jgi:hypothetical protein